MNEAFGQTAPHNPNNAPYALQSDRDFLASGISDFNPFAEQCLYYDALYGGSAPGSRAQTVRGSESPAFGQASQEGRVQSGR